jgi:predicted alpha/beta hydrolase family esterase
MREATVLIVPGLRDHVPGHWQTLLASRLLRVRAVTPIGRDNLDCLARVEAIEEQAAGIDGPIILVAHSGGVIAAVHWARLTRRKVRGALLATPADLDQPLPEGYPSMEALDNAGWLPMPRNALPFRSIVAASRNDPLATYERTVAFACSWGSKLIDLGNVGHLNPACGFGEWPQAEALIDELDAAGSQCWLKQCLSA